VEVDPLWRAILHERWSFREFMPTDHSEQHGSRSRSHLLIMVVEQGPGCPICPHLRIYLRTIPISLPASTILHGETGSAVSRQDIMNEQMWLCRKGTYGTSA
jgi:hypothetical protein